MSSPEALAKLAKHGEDLGYDSLFIGDHIAVPRTIGSPYPYTEGGEFPGADTGESLEQLTTLAYLAGRTEKIRLVTSVLIVPHRTTLGRQGAGHSGRSFWRAFGGWCRSRLDEGGV